MAARAPTALDSALIDIERQLGSGSVTTERDVLESYAHDESETAPHLPDAVVRIRSPEHAEAVMRAANHWRVPVTPRAGGTGRTGGSVPVEGGILLAFERMCQIKSVERDNLVAVAEPGVVLGELHRTVEAEGMLYPPDPNSFEGCCLGGNVAENAGGPRAVKYGSTRDYVLGLEVVTGSGERVRLGKRTTKGVTGYDLTSLVVGSEGTLALITEVTLKLLPRPPALVTLMALLPDAQTAASAVGQTLTHGILPRCFELLDDECLEIVRPQAGLPIPDGAGALLLVELDGHPAQLEAQMEECGNVMLEAGALDVLVAKHGGEREKLWAARRELSRALRSRARFKLAEDVVVPRNRMPALIEACKRIGEAHGIRMPSYGHAGDGNLHCNLLWDDPAQRPAVEAATEALFREVVAMGGTLSGEHGIGVLKAPYLGIEQSAAVIAMQRRIKDLFDPHGVLNPGKIFPAEERPFHGAC